MTATINGERATRVLVRVPGKGAWTAEVDLEEAPEIDAAVTVAIPGLELRGTIVPAESGTHVLERRVRVVGGAGGWGNLIGSRAYHNDSGIRAATVIEDAARDAGETLGAVAPSPERMGIDYVREAGLASRALEEASGGASWWVAFDGTTHVGQRSSADADPDLYEVLDFDPRGCLVTLVTDDLSGVAIGSVLSERLDAPQTVRAFEIDVQPDSVRVRAWCGPEGATDKLGDAFDALVDRAMARRIYGPRKYRVVQMSSDRVELQAVDRTAGLPDIRPISMWPGMAGLHAALTPGSLVLVQFVDGDRTQPVVTHFGGQGVNGWAPTELVLDATSLIKVGAAAEQFAAMAGKVTDQFTRLKTSISGATPVTGDGGAALQTSIIAALNVPPVWPESVAASLVKVE